MSTLILASDEIRSDSDSVVHIWYIYIGCYSNNANVRTMLRYLYNKAAITSYHDAISLNKA